MQDIQNDILIKASEGDLQSFEKVYKFFFSFVFNVAFRVVNKREDAEEVVQEVFMNIYHNLKSFRFESSFRTWVYRITMNTAINYAKKMSKHNQSVEYKEEWDVEDINKNIATEINENNHEKVVAGLLQSINPDQRACIVLRSIEGLSYQEIADVLKIPINTVRTRIKRARETMVALKSEAMKNEMS